MSSTNYLKPLPILDEDSRLFWDAAKRHELVIPRCDACGQLVFFPRPFCPRCEGSSLTVEKLSGLGRVYSYTVVRIAISPAYEPEVPYIVALIDLYEGARLMANLRGCDVDEAHIGMEVEVTFEEATPDVTLPQFKPTVLKV